MQVTELCDAPHRWLVFGRDPGKPDGIIDTNQYMVIIGDRALLMDPGGIEIFAPMLGAILHHVRVDQITDVFASHQDPDIISSLGLWDQALPDAKLHSSGNFNIYEPRCKILMSGDIGAALEKGQTIMFVEDFDSYVRHMRMFHQRWIARVRKLDIEYMAPQHGRIFKGPDVQRFLDWFEALPVGNAIA
jgi:flavorubredoxin